MAIRPVITRDKYLTVVNAYVAQAIKSIECAVDDAISISMRQRVTSGEIVDITDYDENGDTSDLYEYIRANNLTKKEADYVKKCVVRDYTRAGWVVSWNNGEFKLSF